MPDNRIQLLSDHVCNKIAAGEVVERPASVFKELIENAMDADASSIELEVLQGGRKAVIVTDDGCGMSRDDALLSIERHATSKIRDVDDIEHIVTMGFRGEALAAIAAVSRFTLITRRKEDLSGTEIRIAGGTILEVNDIGCPPGTRIEVRNLFYNVPARKKFLRTEATELANIRTLFQVFALGNPYLALKLSCDGRELHRFAAQSSLRDRLVDMMGETDVARMREVDFEDGAYSVSGYAGLSSLHKGDRKDQVIFVNGRPATAPLIGFALKQAYAGSLPRDRHAVAVLHLRVPPDWVDVNVHPTKREVRFRPVQQVRDGLVHALQTALHGRDPHVSPPDEEFDSSAAAPAPHAASIPSPVPPPPIAAPPPTLHPSRQQTELPVHYPPPGSPAKKNVTAPQDEIPPVPAPQKKPERVIPAGPWREVRIIDRLTPGFVVLETDEGLVLMDPQAAHERILYENLLQQLEEQHHAAQALLTPETVVCPPHEADCIRRNLKPLNEIGIGVEEFGDNTFLVESLPTWMGDLAPKTVLHEVALSLDRGGASGSTPQWVREAAAKRCCQLAARRRSSWKEEELKALVGQLAECRMPYTTPFGRSTLIFTSFNELTKKFGID